MHIVEIPLDNGEKILVEVDPPPGIDRTSTRSERAVQVTKQTFEKGLAQLTPMMAAVVSHLRDTEQPPDKINVQFGLKVNGELGLLIGKTATEANFTITAEWTSQEKPPRG